MRIQLKERRQETSDVISFVFDLRGQAFDYRPGQYVFYELDELAFPDERGKRRHFTISSAPSEQGVSQITTRLRGSGFKETLRHAPLGYELTMETPKGNFVVPDGETRQLVFIAGGIGITPFRSMLRHAADTHAPLNATLLYFNRTLADAVFRDELAQIAAQMPSLKIAHILSEPEAAWTGDTGRLDDALLHKHVPDWQRAYFMASGPPPMVNGYIEWLKGLGVADEALRKDSFTGY